jgi:uncharacterized protein with von Willebrand factor type A (vWA) domain
MHNQARKAIRTAGSARWLELSRRAANEVEVALLWDISRNCVRVAVSDDRLCHYLDFEVTRADALGAFNHRFTDATSRLSRGSDLNADRRLTAHMKGAAE